MKIVRFMAEGKEHYGVMEDNNVVSITEIMHFTQRVFPQTIEELISKKLEALSNIEAALKSLDIKAKEASTYKLNEIELLAPIRNPPKIICLGLNYYDHAAEQDAKIPEEPIIFFKPRTTITDPNKPIIKPKFVKKLDYEAELAIVIGKGGKNIPTTQAKHHIFGYTILNDVSARDIQFKDKQWSRGKSFDTFAPIGPCITTADQIKNPNNLKIKTWVNNELRQNSSTKNMVFNVYEIIYHLSKVMTLEPCDIIATGTPAGVGVFMKPKPKFLQPNDRVIIEIQGIGRLENFVVEASP